VRDVHIPGMILAVRRRTALGFVAGTAMHIGARVHPVVLPADKKAACPVEFSHPSLDLTGVAGLRATKRLKCVCPPAALCSCRGAGLPVHAPQFLLSGRPVIHPPSSPRGSRSMQDFQHRIEAGHRGSAPGRKVTPGNSVHRQPASARTSPARGRDVLQTSEQKLELVYRGSPDSPGARSWWIIRFGGKNAGTWQTWSQQRGSVFVVRRR